MPKIKKMNKKQTKNTIEKTVMEKIMSGKIVMKPRWYFILGSTLTLLGLVGVSVGAIFLINLLFFLLRKRGFGILKLQLMIYSFPWWILLLAIILIATGIWFLKKYEFSYKKNFLLIVIAFVVSIFLAAFLIDSMGINETWSRHGFGKRFYNRFEQNNPYRINHRRLRKNPLWIHQFFIKRQPF